MPPAITPATILEAIALGHGSLHAEGQKEWSRFPVRGSTLGDCPRKLAALLRGHKPAPFSPRMLRVFELGHQREGAIRSHLQRGIELLDMRRLDWVKRKDAIRAELDAHLPGGMILHEKRAYALKLPRVSERVWHRAAAEFEAGLLPLHLAGDGRVSVLCTPDIVLGDIEAQTKTIIDIKTKNSFGFGKLDAEGPDEGYAVQLKAQALAMQDEGLEVAGAHLLYENKDTQDHKLVPVPLEPGDRAAIVDPIEALLTRWNDGADLTAEPARYAAPVVAHVLEKKKPWRLPWQCNYCAVGPVVGRCAEPCQVVNTSAKPEGDAPPVWVVQP